MLGPVRRRRGGGEEEGGEEEGGRRRGRRRAKEDVVGNERRDSIFCGRVSELEQVQEGGRGRRRGEERRARVRLSATCKGEGEKTVKLRK